MIQLVCCGSTAVHYTVESRTSSLGLPTFLKSALPLSHPHGCGIAVFSSQPSDFTVSRFQLAITELVSEKEGSRFVWRGKFPSRYPSLKEAAETFGCFGTFVPTEKLGLCTGSTGSLRGPTPLLQLRQRAAEGDCGGSLGGEETKMTGVKVIELFGLTELVDNAESELKRMVFCSKKTTSASLSRVAGVTVDLLRDLGVSAPGKVHLALGGVSHLFFYGAKHLTSTRSAH